MQLDDCFEIGYVLKPHGLKGAVHILLDVDDPAKYNNMESVIVKIDGNLVPFFISTIQINGKKGIIHFEEVNSLDEANALKSCLLLLPISALPKLAQNQFYYHDVIGFTIVDQNHGSLGVIENIITGGNQDLICMEYRGKEILIPIVDDIVSHASHETKEVYVCLPDGLLEIYL